eukprot:5601037-Pyramimonas_sp.AAC.1
MFSDYIWALTWIDASKCIARNYGVHNTSNRTLQTAQQGDLFSSPLRPQQVKESPYGAPIPKLRTRPKSSPVYSRTGWDGATRQASTSGAKVRSAHSESIAPTIGVTSFLSAPRRFY